MRAYQDFNRFCVKYITNNASLLKEEGIMEVVKILEKQEKLNRDYDKEADVFLTIYL